MTLRYSYDKRMPTRDQVKKFIAAIPRGVVTKAYICIHNDNTGTWDGDVLSQAYTRCGNLARFLTVEYGLERFTIADVLDYLGVLPSKENVSTLCGILDYYWDYGTDSERRFVMECFSEKYFEQHPEEDSRRKVTKETSTKQEGDYTPCLV